MMIVSTIRDVREYVAQAKAAGRSVGLVPTMGFLHEGHMALVDTARSQNDLVIASIFVNPLQFGPNEDLESYPRDLQRDRQLLESHGCDLVFAPSVDEMYPRPALTSVVLRELSQPLCGQTRPTHFQGVATVVSKLFNIVQPTRAYFGQKDAQQAVIIKRMVEDLNVPVEVITVPIVREADGLAKSSRNIYLTEAERPHATVLHRTLQFAEQAILQGERDGTTLAAAMREKIQSEPMVKLDYAEIVDADSLAPQNHLSGRILIAVAAYVGKARLIDNIIVTV